MAPPRWYPFSNLFPQPIPLLHGHKSKRDCNYDCDYDGDWETPSICSNKPSEQPGCNAESYKQPEYASTSEPNNFFFPVWFFIHWVLNQSACTGQRRFKRIGVFAAGLGAVGFAAAAAAALFGDGADNFSGVLSSFD